MSNRGVDGCSLRNAMADSTHTATERDVLEANAIFYKAFSDGDYAAMAALWAARAPVACLHPAARALIGRSPVLESWKQILAGPSPFKLRYDHPIAHAIADSAIV